MNLQITRLHPDAKIPTYAHSGDAGMDLYSTEDAVLLPSDRKQFSTGIAMAIPNGYVGLVWDKSGVSQKGGVKTLGGVVDSEYRGEIFVGLVNLSDTSYIFKKGDKIAQMLIQKVERFEILEVQNLDETKRGVGGFGSTGK